MKIHRRLKILLLLVGYLLIQTALANERELGSDGDVRFTLPSSYECSFSAPVTVVAPSPELFAGNRERLQRQLGLIRMSVGFQCPNVRRIDLTGVVQGVTVFKGHAEAANNWVLVTTEKLAQERIAREERQRLEAEARSERERLEAEARARQQVVEAEERQRLEAEARARQQVVEAEERQRLEAGPAEPQRTESREMETGEMIFLALVAVFGLIVFVPVFKKFYRAYPTWVESKRETFTQSKYTRWQNRVAWSLGWAVPISSFVVMVVTFLVMALLTEVFGLELSWFWGNVNR